MKYEDFSEQEKKVIDQFKNFIRNLKFENFSVTFNNGQYAYSNVKYGKNYYNYDNIIDSLSIMNGISGEENKHVYEFLSKENFYLPKFSLVISKE